MRGSNSVGTIIGTTLKGAAYFLTILFATLRACGVIEWGWFWVMSPIFFLYGVSVFVLIIAGCILAIAESDDGKDID